jgi:hypothetical protein
MADDKKPKSSWGLTNLAYSGRGDAQRKKEIEAMTEEGGDYQQYLHEKAAGGPRTESYEEWKKL